MSTSSRSPLSPVILTLLGFIAMVSSVSTDLYLPSFASVSDDLSASASQVQLTLTLFLFGVGAGQLVLGPISDRRGRRAVLLVALAVFALSSAAMVFSPTIEILMALRFIQGLSGAAGLVLSRAIAADLAQGNSAARALSVIMMVSGLGPLIAPLLGGFAHEWWGWRGALASIACIAILMLALSATLLRESLPAERRTSGSFTSVFRPFATIMRDGRFMLLAMCFALGFGGMMSYISASPFVGQLVLGMSPIVYACSFAASASAMVIANFTNMRVVARVGSRRMLAVGVTLLLVGGLIHLACSLAGALSAATFIIGAFVLTAGSGLILSNASALALARVPLTRGSGSALMGALQFLIGGIAAPVVGLWGETTALPMAWCVAIAGVGAVLCAILALRPEREGSARAGLARGQT